MNAQTQRKSRILLAEDDEAFREVLKRVLSEAGYHVDTAPDGESARHILGVHPYDLIVSDLRMPGLDGLGLLEWAKERLKIPFILISGFAHSRAKQEAYEKGADYLISKPLDRDGLIGAIRGCLKIDEQADHAVADQDQEEYYRISLDDFISNRNIPFSIYIRLSDEKIVKLAHHGSDLEIQQLAGYQEKGVRYLYMKSDDYAKYVGFTLQLTSAIRRTDQVSIEKKRAFLKHAGEVILEKVFVDGIDREAFANAKSYVEASMSVLGTDASLLEMLKNLNSHADFLHAHSLGVSLYSVMIARAIGWKSAPSMFKVAMAGLMHDIGFKELDRELIEKPRILHTAAERKEYETHPLRGAELLSQVGNVPVDVFQVAAQHHEDCSGNGYPKHLSKAKVLPVARLVSVADAFCEYAIKNPDSKGMPALAALEQMTRFKSAGLDPQMFLALKEALMPQVATGPRRRSQPAKAAAGISVSLLPALRRAG